MHKHSHPLQDWIDKNGMTRSRLARECGVTPGRISQIMNLGDCPSIHLAARICETTKGAVSFEDMLRHAGRPAS